MPAGRLVDFLPRVGVIYLLVLTHARRREQCIAARATIDRGQLLVAEELWIPGMFARISTVETVTIPVLAFDGNNTAEDVLLEVFIHPPLIQVPCISLEIPRELGILFKNAGQSVLSQDPRLFHPVLVHVQFDFGLVDVIAQFVVLPIELAFSKRLFTSSDAILESVDSSKLLRSLPVELRKPLCVW